MRLLVDTHAFIWYQVGDARIHPELRRLIGDPANEAFLSLASVWEMSIKQSLRKLELAPGVGGFVRNGVLNGFRLLPIELPHVLQIQSLPFHHGDPFDRLLIAQAQIESLTLVSRDRAFEPYDVEKFGKRKP